MRETKAGIATGIGGVGMGGLMTAADQLDWDFPAEVMWVLAILSIIGLFVSGAIWVHLGYEWYQRQRGKLMSGAVGLLLIGIFLAVSGGFLAWKGGQSAFAIYQQPPSEASPAPSQAHGLPRAISPTPQPSPPPKSLAGTPSYPPPAPPQPEATSPRAETTQALKQFVVDVGHLGERAANAQNEAEVAEIDKAIGQTDSRIAAWIYAHMGENFAIQKYRTPGFLRVSMVPWHGSSTDDSGVQRRDQLMSSMLARQANLQDMIAAPTWDKE